MSSSSSSSSSGSEGRSEPGSSAVTPTASSRRLCRREWWERGSREQKGGDRRGAADLHTGLFHHLLERRQKRFYCTTNSTQLSHVCSREPPLLLASQTQTLRVCMVHFAFDHSAREVCNFIQHIAFAALERRVEPDVAVPEPPVRPALHVHHSIPQRLQLWDRNLTTRHRAVHDGNAQA